MWLKVDKTHCYEKKWCHGISRQAGYLGIAAARCLYCGNQSVWRSFQNDAVQGTAGMPTLLCKASTTWPNTSSQMRPDPLCKLTFPENGKDQSCGSTFKYREDCLTLFCCMREGLRWRINCFYVKRVTSTASTPFPAMMTFITSWLLQPIWL